MNELRGFLVRLVGHLDAAGIPYMLAGSLASTYHGLPRATQDVDVIVQLSMKSLQRLIDALPEETYYVNPEAARDALRLRKMFNVIDLDTGWKAGIIVKKNRPFSESEFERRERAEIFEQTVWITSAEDTVLAKLE